LAIRQLWRARAASGNLRPKVPDGARQGCPGHVGSLRGSPTGDAASLRALVSHLRGRLADQRDGKPQRLRESTLQKLRDFLGTFDLRNVVDDQDLKEQVDKARALLEGVSTDALRNMPLIRSRVREGMADLAAQMDVLVNDRVSRKFRFDEA
jgi:hypothetical protein